MQQRGQINYRKNLWLINLTLILIKMSKRAYSEAFSESDEDELVEYRYNLLKRARIQLE